MKHKAARQIPIVCVKRVVRATQAHILTRGVMEMWIVFVFRARQPIVNHAMALVNVLLVSQGFTYLMGNVYHNAQTATSKQLQLVSHATVNV
jgi:hypothetical protein